MKISACVDNSKDQHYVTLTTNTISHSITIPPKPSGLGSSVNGGELLFLALATCYCNDLHREAAKRNIKVEKVEVEVSGDFGAEGDGAKKRDIPRKSPRTCDGGGNPCVDGIHGHGRRNSEYAQNRDGCQTERG